MNWAFSHQKLLFFVAICARQGFERQCRPWIFSSRGRSALNVSSFNLDFTLCTLPGSMGLLHLLSLLPLALACEGGACAASRTAALLSFKAELAKGAASEDEARDGAKNGTAARRWPWDGGAEVCANCSNTSLEHLVMDVILEDMNASGNMPNPEGENNTAGSLGQNLEFLFLKVAQLETAVELQNINFNMAKQDLEHAQMEIQELKEPARDLWTVWAFQDHLVQKNLALEQMRARLLKLDGSKEQMPALGSKHRAAHLAQIRAKRRGLGTGSLAVRKQRGTEAEKILLKVLKKHQRQAQRGWHEEKKPLKDMKETWQCSFVLATSRCRPR